MKECLVTSSALIVLVIVIRALFRGKISCRLQYALWSLVLIRLMLPFPLLGSQLSIMNVVAAGETQWNTHIATQTTDWISQPIASVTSDQAEIETGAGYADKESNISDTRVKSEKTNLISEAAILVWLIGSIATGLWMFGINFVFWRRLKHSRQLFYADCQLPVYVTDQIASPCLFGMLRPAVYLTPIAAETPDCLPFVLTHELCHYRHGDHIWSLLRGLCLSAYWWNPLVWVAAMLSRTDSELACDESVIRKIGGENRLTYGRTLVDMIAVKKAPAGLLNAATTMVSDKRGLKKRLNRIIKNPKTVLPALVAVIILLAVCVGCTFTAAQKAPLSAQEALDKLTSSVTSSEDQIDLAGDDSQQLYSCRNSYIGDATADGTLLDALGVPEKFGNHTLKLDTNSEPYVLTVNFSDKITHGVAAFHREMRKNAFLLLALIGNASRIEWHYQCQFSNGGGSEICELSVEEAKAALGVDDIKSFGQSAAGVKSLETLLQSKISYPEDYELGKMGNNEGDVYPWLLMMHDETELADNILLNYATNFSATPGIDVNALDEYYLLRATNSDGSTTDYYAFMLNGTPMLQVGEDKTCSQIDRKLFARLVSLTQPSYSWMEKID